jgi:hypothetical protein
LRLDVDLDKVWRRVEQCPVFPRYRRGQFEPTTSEVGLGLSIARFRAEGAEHPQRERVGLGKGPCRRLSSPPEGRLSGQPPQLVAAAQFARVPATTTGFAPRGSLGGGLDRAVSAAVEQAAGSGVSRASVASPGRPCRL